MWKHRNISKHSTSIHIKTSNFDIYQNIELRYQYIISHEFYPPSCGIHVFITLIMSEKCGLVEYPIRIDFIFLYRYRIEPGSDIHHYWFGKKVSVGLGLACC